MINLLLVLILPKVYSVMVLTTLIEIAVYIIKNYRNSFGGIAHMSVKRNASALPTKLCKVTKGI